MFGARSELEDWEGASLDEADIRPDALAMMSQYLDDNWTWRR